MKKTLNLRMKKKSIRKQNTKGKSSLKTGIEIQLASPTYYEKGNLNLLPINLSKGLLHNNIKKEDLV